MQTILQIMEKAGGWNPGLSLRIENAPYLPLVIEAIDETGPFGYPAISVCHYGKQNGDAMRDPEMCFELADGKLNSFYWRNDFVGIEQWSRSVDDGVYRCHAALHRQHEDFAARWDRNLRAQGFLEAFERQR